METVLVKSIYPVDTISKGNTKAWAKLISYMEGKDTDTMFDFKGIEVVEPWGTAEFKKFIQNPHVFMTLWNNEKAVNSINIMCKLNNIDTDKAFNESVPVVKAQPTKEELKVAEQAAALQTYFINDNGVGVLQIYKRFDQIGVPKTVSYIEAALKKYAEDNGVSHLKLEAKNIVVQTNVIESVTELIQKLADVGVELDIDSNDTEVMNKVKMYHSLGKSNVNSDQEKIKQITKMLYPGKVGMLIRYKESKATDEFGRSGKGKPLSCRAAVILGMRKNSEGVFEIHIRTYSGHTFYTREHWALEHDNAILSDLDSKREVITLDQFGMYNCFLGSRYHFIEPVQMNPSDSMTMFGIDPDTGNVTRSVLTIPERIKAVFDDFDVKYDKVALSQSIEDTRAYLANK